MYMRDRYGRKSKVSYTKPKLKWTPFVPLTAFYMPMYLLSKFFTNSQLQEGVLEVPLFRGEGVTLSPNFIIIIVALILFYFEAKRATKSDDEKNEADGPNSYFVAIVYVVILITFEFFQEQLFFTFTIMAFLDAVLGNFTIYRAARKDVDFN